MNCGGWEYAEVRSQKGHYVDKFHLDHWRAKGPKKCYTRCHLFLHLSLTQNATHSHPESFCLWETGYDEERREWNRGDCIGTIIALSKDHTHTRPRAHIHTHTWASIVWLLQFKNSLDWLLKLSLDFHFFHPRLNKRKNAEERRFFSVLCL